MRSRTTLTILVIIIWHATVAGSMASQEEEVSAEANGKPRIAFVGLHGGIFPVLQQCDAARHVELVYWSDDAIAKQQIDPARCRVVLVQHVRSELRKQLAQLLRRTATEGAVKIISISGLAEKHLPELAADGTLVRDARLSAYYGSNAENLNRLLDYIRIEYLKQTGTVRPPQEEDIRGKLFHPDHDGLFDRVEDFMRWVTARQDSPPSDGPRAIVAVHGTHLTFQQPAVVAALIQALAQQGVLAVAVVDLNPAYEQAVRDFRPQVIIHTCHSRESIEFRTRLNVPHLHSIFMRSPSIADWRSSLQGLAANDMAFQVTSQELLGAIEPLVGAGLEHPSMAGAFEPIPDRIDHIARRAAGWCRLARRDNESKRIAILYYDREAGKGELMRGSATGMFLNAPRSIVRLLGTLDREGYTVDRLPTNETDLIDRLQDHGRLIGPWNAELLDPLARSGKAALVPVETYQSWFQQRVPPAQRRAVIQQWGEPPGKFMVWRDGGQEFFVIPHERLGNVVLLPQPLRGEAFDASALHDNHVPPPHNYLATYFWLQEEFRADALMHFGTHGSEFLLPGKPTGLSQSDWPDILLGGVPNLQPWIINNLGESSPVRRRAYATLIDHLVPPSVSAGLSDELANLHADIDKWLTLSDGTLKEQFRCKITQQFRDAHLAQDLQWQPLAEGEVLSAAQIQQLLRYLHDLHNETIPTSLHILGVSPSLEQQIPWIVTCLRRRFLDHLNEVVQVPAEESTTDGDRLKYLRKQAESLVEQVLRNGFGPVEALQSVGANKVASIDELSADLRRDLELITRLHVGFQETPQEIDQIVEALAGHFVPPGPSNSPDRNPGVLPTGRNMYLMNPEEVPSEPSWTVGVRLVDAMLEQHRARHGRLPRRVAFSLSSFSTFQDYGVMESQILYLLGIRPVWDASQRVRDLEVIDREELGRPRIDVFISVLGYYRDMLPTRMKLLDQAVRLAAEADEADNGVRKNVERIAAALAQQGMEPDRAGQLARVRLFGAPPGQVGSAGYYYLIERSGQWDTREELMETYLGFARHAYTEGLWGVSAPDTYNLQIEGCDVLLRSWSDRTRSPLSNKYVWYKGGSLSAAITHLTGKEPDWFLSDVRDPDAAQLVEAKTALRRDFRVRLFNRKWIEGMMREGYAGGDQIAVHVSNTLGWKIMRPASVTDDIWNEIVNIYIRDTRGLQIRAWFEAQNPFAFQEVTEILLEAIRKGYWSADAVTTLDVARAYAESVVQHGEGGGLRGGGNEKLRRFVRETLQRAPGNRDQKLAAAFDAPVADAASSKPPAPSRTPAAPEEERSSDEQVVTGPKLTPRQQSGTPSSWSRETWFIACLVVAGLILMAGYRWGHKH